MPGRKRRNIQVGDWVVTRHRVTRIWPEDSKITIEAAGVEFINGTGVKLK